MTPYLGFFDASCQYSIAELLGDVETITSYIKFQIPYLGVDKNNVKLKTTLINFDFGNCDILKIHAKASNYRYVDVTQNLAKMHIS